MALTPNQIQELAAQASMALQELQNDLGRTNVPGARVRFPRGFIRTAADCRRTLPRIGTEVQRRNASYALMTLDVFRWVVTRTDLWGPALGMVVKEGISVYGAILEWLTKEATRGHASNRGYVLRTAKLVELGHIDAGLKSELDWIWDIRCNEHLHEVTELEHEMYSREDYNRALRAYVSFRDRLVEIHGAA